MWLFLMPFYAFHERNQVFQILAEALGYEIYSSKISYQKSESLESVRSCPLIWLLNNEMLVIDTI